MSKPGAKAAPFGMWERAVAGRYLRARRQDAGVALISILAFLGIGAAVLVLIVVMSVMNGFRTELLDKILGFNGHMYVVGELPLSNDRIDATVKRIRAVPGVVQVTPMIEGQVMIVGQGQRAAAFVRGVGRKDVEATPLVSKTIKQGGSLDGYGQGEFGGDLILLGDRLALQLGVGPGDAVTLIAPSSAPSAFGISVNQKDYTVGGVFSVGMSEYDQAFAYMPLEQAQLFFGKEGGVDVIEIKVDDPDSAPALKSLIRQAAGPGASVSDWTEKNQSFFNALQVERTVMRFILFCIVIIAAINIVSGLIMLVKNKSRDIAILRTMGATKNSVLRIFFMAGASVGVAGTLAGLVIGVLFCMNIQHIQAFVEWATGTSVFNADVYFLTHIPARIEWSEVALIVGVSLLVSFIATLPPALRAASLDPVEALRYE
ncbi:MAG: lipoprotein releasing system, transrane protein LolC/E family [Caulobacter sp.]|nr:lipoprotein releasing system, transrane protein LolC/E family [Caulobacter sp.]